MQMSENSAILAGVVPSSGTTEQPALQTPPPLETLTQPASVGWDFYAQLATEFVVALVAGLLIYYVVSWVAQRFVGRTSTRLDDLLYKYLKTPAKVGIPLLCVMFARSGGGLQGVALPILDKALQLAVIATVTWLVLAFINACADYIKLKNDISVPDNRESRRVRTQVAVVGQTLRALVVVAGVAMALMSFPQIKQLGAGLLASAGIVGIAVGIAARPVLENIIAGIQIGITQPIRLDDVVIVEGEWGRVEEITMTYVVVKIWDERRLILPFSKFISNSFQNWTRNSSEILGTIFVWVDYAADVERIRQRAQKIVAAEPLWDKRVFVLQVTETTERAVQLRVLVSAANASSAWDLRVAVREKLIAFLQKEMPEVLPQSRWFELAPGTSGCGV